jgi:hypothetical protein
MYLWWQSSSPHHYWFHHATNIMFLLIETDIGWLVTSTLAWISNYTGRPCCRHRWHRQWSRPPSSPTALLRHRHWTLRCSDITVYVCHHPPQLVPFPVVGCRCQEPSATNKMWLFKNHRQPCCQPQLLLPHKSDIQHQNGDYGKQCKDLRRNHWLL